MNIRQFIYKYLWWTYRPIKEWIKLQRNKKAASALDSIDTATQRVFYLGITNHSNLGDLGQFYCIKKWISENYPTANLLMFEADTIVNPKSKFIEKLKKVYRKNDIIIFQSGYTTQDLGGLHNLMHEMIVEALPKARILMMPQTIFFQHEENKKRTVKILDNASNMLFLARDMVSYHMAINEMFKSVKVVAYPDIVTTLIGTQTFRNNRNGVCLCTRNDGEKFYSDDELSDLAERIKKMGVNVFKKDTQSNASIKEIRKNLEHYIFNEIESYSHFKVTITDRYHGTIFSLCAGTPVVIIKTNDHKVITGADWFKGVYDDYVCVAENLDEALYMCNEILNKSLDNKLDSFFKVQYYDKLKDLFENKNAVL